MNKKQIFAIVILTIFLFSLVSIASAYDIKDEDLVAGDPNLATAKQSFFSMLKQTISGQALTVIDGAACSTTPDYSFDFTPKTVFDDEVCRYNYNHVGIAVQQFEVRSDGSYRYIGELKIEQGDTKCFDVNQGTDYHFSLYYCDSKAVRSCVDTDEGLDYESRGTAKYTIDGDSNSYTDSCVSSDILKEYYCIQDTISSKTRTCSCSDGECVEDIITVRPETEVLASDLKLNVYDVSSERVVVLGEQFVVTGKIAVTGVCTQCVVETGGDFYGQALSIASFGDGACGDDETVGAKFSGEDEVLSFSLVDKISEPGTYRVPVYVGDKCGGDILDTEYFTIIVEEEYVPPVIPPVVPSEPEDEVLTCNFCAGEEVKSIYAFDCPLGTTVETIDCSAVEDIDCSNDDSSVSCVPSEDSSTIQKTDDALVKPKLIDLDDDEDVTILFVGLTIVVLLIIIFMGGSNEKK